MYCQISALRGTLSDPKAHFSYFKPVDGKI